MAITQTSFKLTFRLDTNPKSFQIEDTTDYSLQGADNNDIIGLLRIDSPSGLWKNQNESTPDIDKSVSDLNQTTLNIPVLDNGEPEPGTYTFTYRAIDQNDSSFVEVTKTFDFCYHSPSVELEMTADCIAPLLTSTDTSNYTVRGVTPEVDRAHQIFYPPSLGVPELNGSSIQLATQVFFTKTHTSVLTSTLLYDYSTDTNPDIFIQDSVKGSQEIQVECDATLCDLYCCLFNLYSRFKEQQGKNRTLACELEEKFLRAQSIRNLIKDAYECGKQSNVPELVQDVLDLGDCEEGCGCVDENPVPVIGITSTPVVPFAPASGTGDGEANDAVNLGAGEGLYAGKVGVNLQLKSLKAGNNITLSSDGDEVTINAASLGGSGGGTIVEAGDTSITVTPTVNGSVTTYSIKLEDSLQSKLNGLFNTTLVAGDGIAISPTTDVDGNISYEVRNSVINDNNNLRLENARYILSVDLSASPIPDVRIVAARFTGNVFEVPNRDANEVNWLRPDGNIIRKSGEASAESSWESNPARILIQEFYDNNTSVSGKREGWFLMTQMGQISNATGPHNNRPFRVEIYHQFQEPIVVNNGTAVCPRTSPDGLVTYEADGAFALSFTDNNGQEITGSQLRGLDSNITNFFVNIIIH